MENQILVVIPTIIDHSTRYRLLEQLENEPEVDTVLVVDNGNNFSIVTTGYHSAWQQVEYFQPGCNLNWLHSCNVGATLALEREKQYVCFLNDDVELSNPFFKPMLETFERHPDAGLVAPAYNGVFCREAITTLPPEAWWPQDRDIPVNWVDGTCMLISRETLKRVGLLDTHFKAPGWGADVDYSFRASQSGLKPYVSHRAAVWHQNRLGGRSAAQLYGSKQQWLSQGSAQAKSDLEAKYGPQWRDLLSIYPEAYEIDAR